MVLYKRKAVGLDGSARGMKDSVHVWVIQETGEVFGSYDAYLKRIYFYSQKKFTCSITGLSGLDFFSALRSELDASHDVDDIFPDALKEPILNKVQHSTISRIDNLVDHVYDGFKQDFYPGESVYCIVPTSRAPEGERTEGFVREKIRVMGNQRYLVSLLGNGGDNDAYVDPENLFRDRKAFTKQMLRPFLKNALQREAWTGAPWQVKPELAEQYKIDQRIPKELTYEHQLALRKAVADAKKEKSKPSSQEQQRIREQQYIEYKRAIARDSSIRPDQSVPQSSADLLFLKFIAHHPGFTAKSIEPKQLPLPPLKYPREDLELPISSAVRPALNFFTPTLDTDDPDAMDGVVAEVESGTVGRLLEAWNTLNVYCEVFLLDSFTFDDFIAALQFTPDQSPAELVHEVHCALLKKLVNSELDKNGQVQINLPEDDEEEEESEDDESEDDASPSPEPEVQVRTTRSSLAKTEAAELSAQAAIAAKLHNGPELDQCVKGYDWKARLRKRDFSGSRWIIILVGLLNVYTNAARSATSDECDEILKVLAPKDAPATEDTAIDAYYSTDISVRARILQFLCTLSTETKAVREYMEQCSQDMTEFRKEKIEWQRKKKALIEDLKKLDEERRELQPELAASDPGIEQLKNQVDAEVKEEEENREDDDDDADEVEDDEQDDVRPARSLRRGHDRANERKKAADEAKKKAKAEAEKARKATKEEKRLEKLLRQIEEARNEIKECEEQVVDHDNDLREADCQRTRVLGIDRFWNRYYWFERNGMPFGGLPDSSTAHAGYANGCLWVQGPCAIEREGFIEMNEADNQRYKEYFQMSVPERQVHEEGNTHVFTATDWGYYDDPEELDKLIGWLDVKGVREVKLRKQLFAYYPHIVAMMEKRKDYLGQAATAEREASEEPTTKRVSTRTKNNVEQQIPCRWDRWHNSMAENENGYIHSEPPRGTKRGATSRVVSGRTKPAPKKTKDEEIPEVRQTRGAGRVKQKSGKGYGLR